LSGSYKPQAIKLLTECFCKGHAFRDNYTLHIAIDGVRPVQRPVDYKPLVDHSEFVVHRSRCPINAHIDASLVKFAAAWKVLGYITASVNDDPHSRTSPARLEQPLPELPVGEVLHGHIQAALCLSHCPPQLAQASTMKALGKEHHSMVTITWCWHSRLLCGRSRNRRSLSFQRSISR
jgi:hypothetical protein